MQSTGHIKGSLWGSDNVVSFAAVGVVIDLCWVGVERSIGTFLYCHNVPHSFQILWHSPGELVSISPLHSLIILLCPNYQKKNPVATATRPRKETPRTRQHSRKSQEIGWNLLAGSLSYSKDLKGILPCSEPSSLQNAHADPGGCRAPTTG